MKRILLGLLLVLTFPLLSRAQGPKWVSKARKAVLTVTTFDENGSLLRTGNGFFISESGVAVSDFALFKGAYKAIAVNTEGKELLVESILGADDTYDIVKFKIGSSNAKKNPALSYYTTPLSVGDEVIVLPYSVEKSRSCLPGKVKKIDSIANNRNYLTLDFRMNETMISCPVMNTEGQVIGILQKPYGESDGMTSHVLDIHLVDQLEVNALSSGNYALKEIPIKKGLPQNEEQALVYLYIMAQQFTASEYAELLNDYIAQFPASIEGYLKRAQFGLDQATQQADIQRADADMEQAKQLATDRADFLFRSARMIMSNQANELLSGSKKWSVDEALTQINQAIDLENRPIYWQVKAEILTTLERFDQALEAYEQVNQSDLASPLSYYSASQVKLAQGAELTEVIGLMDSCIQLLPKPYNKIAAPYLYQRAMLLEQTGQYREALVDMKEFYYAVDGQVEAVFFYEREQVALKARLYQQALDDLTIAIQMAPEEPLYQLELASINLRLGRNQEALEAIEVALQLDDKSGEAYRLQGVAYLQLKDKRACASLHKALSYGDTLAQGLINKHCQ